MTINVTFDGTTTIDVTFEEGETFDVTIGQKIVSTDLVPEGTSNLYWDYDADNNKIVNVSDPVTAQDAATKNYVDNNATAGFTLENARSNGNTYQGDVDYGNNSITSVKTVTYDSVYSNGSSGASFTVDFTNGQFQNLDVDAELNLTLSNNGEVGLYNLEINQATTAAWNLDFFEYSGKSFEAFQFLSNVREGQMGKNGTRLYILTNSPNRIYQFNLSTPYDITTAQDSGKFLDISGQESNAQGMSIKPDGTRIYAIGTGELTVFEYAIGTAWELDSGSYTGNSINVSANNLIPLGVDFKKDDGTKMFILDNGDDLVTQYTLSTPWGITTATFDNVTFTIPDGQGHALFFKPDDGSKMYILGDNNRAVFEVLLVSPWDISATTSTKSFDVSGQNTAPRGMFWADDTGNDMYIADGANDIFYQYSLNLNLVTPSNINFTNVVWSNGEPTWTNAEIGEKIFLQFFYDGTRYVSVLESGFYT